MAAKDDLLQDLKTLLGEEAFQEDGEFRAGVACTVRVPLAKLRDAIGACRQAGYYLESVAGLDFKDTDEIVYHVNCYEPYSRIVLRVLRGKDQAVPSVSDIFPSALWQEREVWEFFGIEFSGHPDLKQLLLPEDADFHPHRKDFGKVYAYHEREKIYG